MTTPRTGSKARILIKARNAYFAKRCPRAIELDELRPCEPLEPTAPDRARMEAGVTFEDRIFETLAQVNGALRVDSEANSTAQITQTKEAMDKGAPVILAGYLPLDSGAKRVGKPDVLVRRGQRRSRAGNWAYLAVDVKHHQVLADDAADGDRICELGDPRFEAATQPDGRSVRWRWRDLCQLAHYHRILAVLGYATDQDRWGGIIGSEELLAWYDLGEPCWEPPLREGAIGDGAVSTLELYEAEFDFRMKVYRTVLHHQNDPSVPLLADAMVIEDCGGCDWREPCFEEMTERCELTLLPALNAKKRASYRTQGVANIGALASLDPATALLLDDGVELADLLVLADDVEPGTELGTLIPRRQVQLANLAGAGITTVGDLARIDRRTTSCGTHGFGKLTPMIDVARAWLGADAVYLKRGVTEINVPRGDIEVDIDLECDGGATYLWGMLVTDRTTGSRFCGSYEPFVSWNPDPDQATADAFERLWKCLRSIRSEARRNARTVRVYCYNKGTEQSHLRKGSALLGRYGREVDALIKSNWVRLRESDGRDPTAASSTRRYIGKVDSRQVPPRSR